MAIRAYWKGYLRLSLVTIRVELYPAAAGSSRLSLHQIHEPSGKRVRHQKVAPSIGPVDTDEIVKGYEIDKDKYVLIEPDELDAIKLESRHTIDLVQFVEHCEIDPRYFDKPFYVVPADDEVAEEGFVVIREALRKAKRVALGQMAVRGRDYIVAIMPCGDGLLLETLRYAEEIRKSNRVFNDIPDIKVEGEMLKLAEELVERKSAPFKAEAFKSKYIDALRDLIEEKRKKGVHATGSQKEHAEPAGGNVVDLMEALKKSVARGKKTTSSKRKKRRTRGTSTRRAAG
ncbi:MAG: Ku protein [Alphaproteobacteria bacterium]|nr:Ku protein [Alphaproteobacteria bacterium]